MRIEKIDIKNINPAKYNPRKNLQPTDKEYQRIKNSIEKFGYIDPLIWNERTGTLVGGHQRFKILKDKGESLIECVVVNFDETTEKAANATLNKATGEWDDELLEALLSDLKECDFDMKPFDFDEKGNITIIDIDNLLSEINTDEIITKPIWATIRTSIENKDILEKALSILKENGIRIERSYD